mgnify:CR=1 FL=1
MEKTKTAASIDNIYSLDGKVPLLKSIPFGLQHVLAMFVAIVFIGLLPVPFGAVV